MFRRIVGPALALLMLGESTAYAHHSFAVFFDSNKILKIKGTVTEFRFTNPHGTITLDVTGDDGKVSVWRAETNAPVVLMRRGWSRDSLKAGDVITLEGWASRDGKPYLRLRTAYDANGKQIGQPFGTDG